MTTIKIAASLDEEVANLNGLGRLLTAGEWERAARVATFVTLDSKPGPKGDLSVVRDLTPVEFGKLGIVGLKSDNTVRRYVQAWLDHRPRPLPGDVIDMDGLPEWPTRYGEGKEKHGAARSPGQTATALADPEFVGKVIKKMTPEAAHTIAEALVNDRDASLAIARAQNKRATKEGIRAPKPKSDDGFAGVDFLLLQAAKQHIRDFARKMAAARVAADAVGEQMPHEIQRMIVEDIDDLIRYLMEIKALTRGEIRLHLTDDDLDALLSGGER